MTDLAQHLDELVPLANAVSLKGRSVLDIGCGNGALARRIAAETGAASVIGIDTDAAQIAKNIEKGRNVNYQVGGVQALGLADSSIDVAVLMKSLHHVPMAQMDAGFAEILRVLRPDGQVYICEPAYSGDFNEILKIFHDEGEVRAAAQAALGRATAGGGFKVAGRHDYIRPLHFADIEGFKQKMLYLPWLENHITKDIETRVEAAFAAHANPDGSGDYTSHMLVVSLVKA